MKHLNYSFRWWRSCFFAIAASLLLAYRAAEASIPILFRSESSTCGLTFKAIPDWLASRPRQARLKQIARRHFNQPTASVVAQYVSLLKDFDVLPEGGALHFAGLGTDFFSPLLALIERPDVTIFISESGYSEQQVLRSVFFELGNTLRAYAQLVGAYPETIKVRPAPFVAEIRSRIHLTTYVQNQVADPAFGDYTPSGEPEAILPADLTFVRYPHRFGPWDWDRVNDTGIVWVLTELTEVSTSLSPPHVELPKREFSDLYVIGHFNEAVPDRYQREEFPPTSYLVGKPRKPQPLASRKEHYGPPLMHSRPVEGQPIVETPASPEEILRLIR